jgi:hypothetical protein
MMRLGAVLITVRETIPPLCDQCRVATEDLDRLTPTRLTSISVVVGSHLHGDAALRGILVIDR